MQQEARWGRWGGGGKDRRCRGLASRATGTRATCRVGVGRAFEDRRGQRESEVRKGGAGGRR
eukprot:332710-Hanusia_phi.AAC.1